MAFAYISIVCLCHPHRNMTSPYKPKKHQKSWKSDRTKFFFGNGLIAEKNTPLVRKKYTPWKRPNIYLFQISVWVYSQCSSSIALSVILQSSSPHTSPRAPSLSSSAVFPSVVLQISSPSPFPRPSLSLSVVLQSSSPLSHGPRIMPPPYDFVSFSLALKT